MTDHSRRQALYVFAKAVQFRPHRFHKAALISCDHRGRQQFDLLHFQYPAFSALA